MKMKIRLGVSLLIACLPWLAMAQNDDLYFVPKKEKKAETKTEVRQVTRQTTTTTTTTASVSPGTTVVVKDVTGKTRDIDEYNRRYTSRENTFSMQNDTSKVRKTITNTPCVSSVSVVRRMPFLSAAPCIGMLCMVLFHHGTGTYTTMDYMLTCSPPILIRCGGTGAGTGV